MQTSIQQWCLELLNFYCSVSEKEALKRISFLQKSSKTSIKLKNLN